MSQKDKYCFLSPVVPEFYRDVYIQMTWSYKSAVQGNVGKSEEERQRCGVWGMATCLEDIISCLKVAICNHV